MKERERETQSNREREREGRRERIRCAKLAIGPGRIQLLFTTMPLSDVSSAVL